MTAADAVTFPFFCFGISRGAVKFFADIMAQGSQTEYAPVYLKLGDFKYSDDTGVFFGTNDFIKEFISSFEKKSINLPYLNPKSKSPRSFFYCL